MTEHVVGLNRQYTKQSALVKANVLSEGDRIIVEPGLYVDDIPLYPCSVEIVCEGGLADPAKMWCTRNPSFNNAARNAIATFYGVSDPTPQINVAIADLRATQPTPYEPGDSTYLFTKAGSAETLLLTPTWWSKVSKGIITAKLGVPWLKVSGIEFRNALIGSTYNGAGIRAQANTSLEVRSSRFVMCQDGALTGSNVVPHPSGPLVNLKTGALYALAGYVVIDGSEFEECGRGGTEHSIYIGPCAEAVVANNKFKNARQGHHIKLNMGGGGVAVVWGNDPIDEDLVDLSQPSTHGSVDMESGHFIVGNNRMIKVRSDDSDTNQSQQVIMGNRRGWSPTGNTLIYVHNYAESRAIKTANILIARDSETLKPHDSADMTNSLVAEFVSRDPGDITGYVGENGFVVGPRMAAMELPPEITVGANQIVPLGTMIDVPRLPVAGPSWHADMLPFIGRLKQVINPAAIPSLDKIADALKFMDQFAPHVVTDSENEEDPEMIKELQAQVQALQIDLQAKEAQLADSEQQRAQAVAERDAAVAKIGNFNSALTALSE